MDKRQLLIDFIEKTDSFDNISKLKLILFATGVKPNTFVALKITSRNIQDKFHFERHLIENGIVYVVSRPKSFEEISSVTGNKVVWRMKGVWYGYDLFKNEKNKKAFNRYVQLLRRRRHRKADILAGKIYGYPVCCIRQYIKEHNREYLKRRYTYYEYYKRLKDSDKKFTFLNHTACSVTCNPSTQLNKKYAATVRKNAKRFWKEYIKKKKYNTDLLVDGMSDVYADKFERKSIWSVKDGYEYALIAKKPYKGHYYMYSYLTKKLYEKGTVLNGTVKMQYNHAEIKIKSVKGVVKKLHHERRILGRK